jgi:protein gp37
MSDLFHPDVPDEYIERVAKVMAEANWHTYQILTKRSERLRNLLNGQLRFAANCRHIWWGVSVEDKRYGKPRVEHLRSSRAAVKFLSVEPLLEDLGELRLSKIDWVIVGGESGPGARPIKESWVEGILSQCRAAAVPFFFKQWGGAQKKRNGRELHGRTYDEFPAITAEPIPPREHRLSMVERLRGPLPLVR